MDEFVSAEVPLRFEDGMPYTVLRIGNDSIEVYLDTGAGSVSVALLPETVGSLRLRSWGKVRTLKTHYGSTPYRRVSVPEIRLGGLTFLDLLCDQIHPADLPFFKKRGLLGLALLRPFRVLIDYGASKLILCRSDGFPAGLDSASCRRIPFADHSDGIWITGVPDGVTKCLKWCLDTGAVARDANRTKYYNIMKLKHFRGMADARERDGRAVVEHASFKSEGTVLDSLNFLSHEFSEPGGVDGFLGTDFFMKNRVFIDFVNGVLWIQPGRDAVWTSE